MKRFRRIALLVVLIAIAAGLSLRLMRAPEPEYQGRGLSSWLVEFDDWEEGNTNSPVVVAIRAMGAKAVPILVEVCLTQDSTFKQKISVEFEKRPGFMKYRFTTAPERWLRAEHAFGVLGPEARGAFPTFLAALTNDAVFTRSAAVSGLGAIGPAAEECLPALIALQNDPKVHRNLIHTLGKIGRRPDLCVPLLMKGLEDADAIIRNLSIQALGGFGRDARVAVPALIDFLSDKSKTTVRLAAETLGKIGPDAATALPALERTLEKEATSKWISRATTEALERIKSGEK
ncbi:MAG: repeat-containing protein [Verrucomicrobiales bacterium]|nr:repeat-containing protein [Verrucomicrobiales bacterium]